MSTLASRSRSLLLVAVAAGGAACAEAIPGPAVPAPVAVVPGVERFRATLSPSETVPAAASEASGEVNLSIVDGHLLVIDLSAPGLVGATEAQASAGRRGEVGAALAEVFRASPARSADAGASMPILLTTIERSEMPSPRPFDELVRKLRAGTAYLNVRTVRFPSGEVRGQFVPVAKP